ncbi:MAG: hypothetical protein IJ493_09195 [Clostridia bacterium]|nr:hypothetical protein [Clostridia bacterium]
MVQHLLTLMMLLALSGCADEVELPELPQIWQFEAASLSDETAPSKVTLSTGTSSAVIDYVATDAGNVWYVEDKKLVGVTPDGERLASIGMPDDMSELSVVKPAVLSDGQGGALLCYPGRGNSPVSCYRPIDEELLTLGDPLALPEISSAYTVVFGSGYDVWYYNSIGLYAQNLGGEPVTICNWLNTGVPGEVAEVVISSPERIQIRLSGGESGILTPMPETEQLLEVAVCGGKYWKLWEAAVAFRESSELTPVFVEYTDEQLTVALQSDNPPDLVVGCDESFDEDAFLDLYTLLDGADGLGRDDLLDCVLEPFEREDGGLAWLTQSFTLSTLAGRTSALGGGWTIESLADGTPGYLLYRDTTGRDTSDNLPDWAQELTRVSDSSVLLELMLGSLSADELDKETLTALLELCAGSQLLAGKGETKVGHYQDGTIRLRQCEFETVMDFLFDVSFVFERNIAVSYCYVNPAVQFAIPAGSDQAGEAWAFVCRSMNPAGTSVTDNFPALREGMSRLLEYAGEMKYRFRQSEASGQVIYTKACIDVEVKVEQRARLDRDRLDWSDYTYRFTDVDKALFEGLLETAVRRRSIGEDALALILSEAEACFSGKRSAADAAERIMQKLRDRP